jgi:HSP20 family protein
MLTRFGNLEPRFGVFDELRRRMDRLWDDWDFEVVAPAAAFAEPSIALRDEGDKLVATVDVPGMREEDLKVEVKGALLTLSGERKVEAPKGYTVRRQERPLVKFAHALTLPCAVDSANATASLKDGVLAITMPKAPEAKPRTIAIRKGGEA